MRTITGTYHNGELKLDRPFITKKPVKVTITIEENEATELKLSDFSFAETQEFLKEYTTSFSDEVVEERRREL